MMRPTQGKEAQAPRAAKRPLPADFFSMHYVEEAAKDDD